MAKQFYRILDNLSPSEMKLTNLPRKPNSLNNMFFNEYGQLVKRKGYEKYNTTLLHHSEKIRGMHRYYKSATEKEFLVACNGKIYKLSDIAPHNGVEINTSLPLTFNKDVYFADFYQTCYLVNGADGMFKYNGSSFYKVGITPPSAPTFNSRINGALTAGNYYFKVTYVDVDGYESNGSPSSAAMVAQADPNDGIKINIPVSTDPKVKKRRIYRTTMNGSSFYYDGEVANNTTTTYSSTKSDTQISMGTFLHDDHNEPPATPQYICKRRSRLMLADKDAFYISHIADVEYFPPDWVIYTGARQDITGIIEQQESMAVFTQDSIERLIGQDEDNFEFVNAYSSEGCIAPRSLVNCENLLLYLGCDGIYAFDGVSAQILNIPLAEYLKNNINNTYAYLSSAEYFDNKYLLSYPKGTSNVPNETVYIDFRTGATGVYNFGFSCYSRWDKLGDGIQLYGGSNTVGQVYKIGVGTSDEGRNINAYDDVCHLDLGVPELKKLFYAIWIKVISTDGENLRVYYQIDDDEETYQDIVMDKNTEKWYRIALPDSCRGRAIKIRPSVNDIYDITFCGYMLEFDVESGEY